MFDQAEARMRLHPVSSIQYSQKYNAKMAHLAEIIF
jgi:hypothetical protein